MANQTHFKMAASRFSPVPMAVTLLAILAAAGCLITGTGAGSMLPLILLVVAAIAMASVAFIHWLTADLRSAAEKNRIQNERNQEAILRLLDEISNLAQGDLTVSATVTEDITGAIADSINYAIEALRELV